MNPTPIVYPIPNPDNPCVSVLCAGVDLLSTPLHHRYSPRANLLISSRGLTYDTGELTFHLENLWVTGGRWGDIAGRWSGEAVITDPTLVFIATALSKSPVVITWTYEFTIPTDHPITSYFDLLNGTQLQGTRRYDIAITVRSWTLDSQPAPHVPVGWLCIAEGAGYEYEDRD